MSRSQHLSFIYAFRGLEPVKLAYESIVLRVLRSDVFTGLFTKCVAAQCECTFFSISASSITSKLVGDAERIMRTLCTVARERHPNIIFIDEIDSLLAARCGKNEETRFGLLRSTMRKQNSKHELSVGDFNKIVSKAKGYSRSD